MICFALPRGAVKNNSTHVALRGRGTTSAYNCFSATGLFFKFNPFTATGYFDIPPPRWPTFLVTLFPMLKEVMGLSLLDEFEVQYHVIKK